MKCYLDTNCVRQINKFKDFGKYDVFTSALSIFEIISGIDSEKEYIKRKNILKSIQNSKLNILWELPITMMIKSFGFPISTTDVNATEIMMNKIIESSTYDDMLKIRFNLGGEDYILETFTNHDNEINSYTQFKMNDNIQKTHKDLRKELRTIVINSSLVRLNKEILIRNFLMDILNISEVDNQQYIKAIETYFQDDLLNNYFILIILLPHKALSEGQNAGSNDGMDYQHLIFTHDIDFFVSDDKFYKRIPKNISEYLDFEFIESNHFNSMIQ